MAQLPHHPHKQDFQVERMIFFSDAVFAIAITILVIELKVPMVSENATESDFLKELAKQIPQISGLLISFFLIGVYWTAHHNLFGFVINYTKKLLWLNLIFLFTIVIMPFSTAIYSEYSFTEGHLKLISPYAVYVFNICFTGIMNYILINYVTNPKNKIAEFVPIHYAKYSKLRSLLVPAIFLISLLVCFIDPGIGRMVLFIIPFAMAFLSMKLRKENSKSDQLTSKKMKS